MNDALKTMIIFIVFILWLWKMNAIYNRYTQLQDMASGLTEAQHMIYHYKITGIRTTNPTLLDNKNNVIIPEWNGTSWVYYQIPMRKIGIKIETS